MMGQAIALRDDFRADDLRMLARASQDANQVRRLLAIASILDGASRTEAAKVGNADIQTLRDWVVRFNAEGPDGLINRFGGGRPRELTDEQLLKFALIAEMEPELRVSIYLAKFGHL
jgi:transposase